MRLECPECVVRDWTQDDKADLVRHADNRNVWRNLTHLFPHPYTDADADAWLAIAAVPETTNWAIEVDGHAVGGIGLVPGKGVFAKKADIGYWLGEPYWGRGIMTAAVRLVQKHAIDDLGLVRLEAAVYAWNPASMRVLEHCGFQREGVMRAGVFKEERFVDEVLYGFVDESRV